MINNIPRLDLDVVEGGLEQAMLTALRQFAAGVDDVRPSDETVKLAEQAVRLAYRQSPNPLVGCFNNGDVAFMLHSNHRRIDTCVVAVIAADGSARLMHYWRRETDPIDQHTELWDWNNPTTADHIVALLDRPAKDLKKPLPVS